MLAETRAPRRRLLPRGGLLAAEQWRARHRLATRLLAAHLPALLLLGLARDAALPHVLAEVGGLALLLGVAQAGRLPARLRAAASSLGLVGCSAALVHLAGGVPEAHYHFFVVVLVVALYEDWAVLGLAVAVSLLHHAALSLVSPVALYGTAHEQPLLWALLHAGALSCQCALALWHWRDHERALLAERASTVRLVEREAAVQEHERRAQLHALQRQRQAELQAANTELAAARDAALAASRATSAFLTTTSHALRTPLNGVLGMTGLLLAGELSAAQRERAELVRQSGEGLRDVVEDVLDLAALDAGRVVPARAPFDLRALLDGVLAPLRPVAQEQGLALGLDVGPEVPAAVEGDAGRLRQVLRGLLGNALTFTDAGEVRLAVEAVHEGSVWFAVRDTGVGVPAADQERLFEPFAQGDASSTRRHAGTGLGLTVARDLVRLLGGELLVSSRDGDGAVFSFSLPLTAVAPPAPVPVPVPVPVPAPSPARDDDPPRPLRLLLAEDSPVNQAVAVGLLGALGCEVDVVDDGQQALDRLAVARDAYDALLLDCQMPVLDGYDAVREVRRREEQGLTRRLPVVALTASAREEDRDRCLAAGMDDYFSKPFSPEQVVAVLQRLVPAG